MELMAFQTKFFVDANDLPIDPSFGDFRPDCPLKEVIVIALSS